MTVAQDWARERNLLGGSILGMITRLTQISYSKSLLSSERQDVIKAEKILKNVASEWRLRKEQSKRKYLREVLK